MEGKGKKAMELNPVGVGAGILSFPNVDKVASYSDGHEIMKGKTQRSVSHESESSSSCSSSKCQLRSCTSGSLSKCGHQNLASNFVTSCSHGTCKVCLKSHVQSIVEKSIRTLEPSYDEIRIQLLCPDQRCGMELSKEDLFILLDVDSLKRYENWLRTVYRDLYGAESCAKMINCNKCKRSATNCSRMFSIEGKGKSNNIDDVNQFQGAASNESTRCPDSWKCTICNISWCAACGFTFDSQYIESECKLSHVCSEATNYRINGLVRDLELIYYEYNRGIIKSKDQPDTRKTVPNIGSNGIPLEIHSPYGSMENDSTGFPLDPYGPYGSMENDSSGIPLEFYDSNDSMQNTKAVWGAGTEFGDQGYEAKSTEEKLSKVDKEIYCQKEKIMKLSQEIAEELVSYVHGTSKLKDQPGTSKTALSIDSHQNDSSENPMEFYDLHDSIQNTKTVWGAGTGFGGQGYEGKSTEEEVRKVEKELDYRTEIALKSLTNILKNKASNQTKPILGFSAHVLFSRENVVVQILEYLVTNDSMMDICARSALYLQVSEVLKTMAQYPELLKMLIGSCFQTDRREVSHVHGNFGSSTSVFRKMKNIREQSNIIVNRFKDRNNEEYVEAELEIARSLLKCYEKLATAAEKEKSSTSAVSASEKNDLRLTGDDKATPASKEVGSKNMEDNEVISEHCKNASSYKESLKPFQFGEYPLIETGFQHHTYSHYFDVSGANLQSIDNTGVHNKKRMMHIAKEMASLATNLPMEWESSIHVRVDPVRMDLLKALIVGPKGTPYQNGVFIFDIYLPPDYPQVPPKVNFLTTGCGTVRFNPNLYSNGMVCLSLLGTWNGPSWQPWKSTLLQVLVSIQSLIFVAEPFYNEPGNEMLTNIDRVGLLAESENRDHRFNTLKIAILGSLRDPDSSFKDVITRHFLHKKDEIIDQCNEWIAASGGPTKPMHNQVVSIANEVIMELSKVEPL